MLKRVITLLFCIIIIFVAIFGFAVGVVSVPTFLAYAEDIPVGYTQVDSTSELTDCFLAYCRSRDTDIVGGGANVIANFTYSAFLDASKALGINLTELQSELYYKQDGNQGIKWFMTATGVSAFNNLFAKLITEAGLEVGDTADEQLYSGYYLSDDDGNTCLVYVVNNFYKVNNRSDFNESNYIISRGTYLKYTTSDLINCYDHGISPVINYRNEAYNVPLYKPNNYFYSFENSTSNVYSGIYADGTHESPSSPYIKEFKCEGYTIAVYDLNTNKTYIGRYSYCMGKYGNNQQTYNRFGGSIQALTGISYDGATNPVTINFITINNSTIKNEYEGDTYINNEGDVINEGDNNTTINYNPYPGGGGTTTGPNTIGTGSDGITFPDINLNLPEINWSIGDLSNKFPFSIPFDLVALVRVLDAPPEAPRFQGTLDLGVTTYNYDINLEAFNPVASACRIAETLLFVFVLIMITRNLIKG